MRSSEQDPIHNYMTPNNGSPLQEYVRADLSIDEVVNDGPGRYAAAKLNTAQILTRTHSQ